MTKFLRIIFFLCLLWFIVAVGCARAFAQTHHACVDNVDCHPTAKFTMDKPVFTGYTVASLPAAPVVNQVAIVTDGASASDCTTGHGSSRVLCSYNGSAWAVIGGGGGGSGTPASPDGSVQFNNGGAFGGIAAFKIHASTGPYDPSYLGGSGDDTEFELYNAAETEAFSGGIDADGHAFALVGASGSEARLIPGTAYIAVPDRDNETVKVLVLTPGNLTMTMIAPTAPPYDNDAQASIGVDPNDGLLKCVLHGGGSCMPTGGNQLGSTSAVHLVGATSVNTLADIPHSTVDFTSGAVTITATTTNASAAGLAAVSNLTDTAASTIPSVGGFFEGRSGGSSIEGDSVIGLHAMANVNAGTGHPVEQTAVSADTGGSQTGQAAVTVTGVHVHDQNSNSVPGSAVNAGILIDNQTGGANVFAIKTGTGPVSFGDKVLLHADPTDALGAATKQYVDNQTVVPPVSKTCPGTDKLSAYDAATGVYTCTTDQAGSPGSGITDLNGSSVTSQSFVDGTNIHVSTNTGTGAHTIAVTGLGDAAAKNTGTTTGTVMAGDDSRVTSLGTASTHATTDYLASSTVLPANTTATTNQFFTAYNSSTGAYTKAQPTWANIDKTTSSLADLTTRSASDLSSGTLAAAQMPALTGECTSSAGSVAVTCGTGIAHTGVDINTTNQVTLTHLASALPVAQGGWGLATLTAHALYAGNGTSAPGAIGPDASTTKFLAAAGSSANPAFRAIALADLPDAMKRVPCQFPMGNGFNPILANAYPEDICWNDTDTTLTILAISCFSDNAGSSTLAVTNNAGTSLLTAPITCGPNSGAGVSGTQSATTTLAANDHYKLVFTPDGVSTRMVARIKATR